MTVVVKYQVVRPGPAVVGALEGIDGPVTVLAALDGIDGPVTVVGALGGLGVPVAQPFSAGHPSVRVTVPVYGEPAGPTGMVKVCVVVRLPGAGPIDPEKSSSSAVRFEEGSTEGQEPEGTPARLT